LGARYFAGDLEAAGRGADVVVECTGVGQLVFDATGVTGPNGIVCLTGLSSGKRLLTVDANAVNRELVLENVVVFGTVNANRRHYEAAMRALGQADRRWLDRLLTRQVRLRDWRAAYERRPQDIKTVLRLD
jgi:glucose 1-dehydrogenase